MLETVQHLLAFLVEPTSERVHVGHNGFLAQVVLDNGRHIGVDELVVTHPIAHRAGDHHVPGARGVEQARDSEHRIRAELHGIQVGVIDAAVDHVDLALTLGGAHVDLVVAAEQIAPLDEFHTHLASQQ
ncbi:Uncharacterised protein [Mycobacteroides abscessus subsp. abscessus]|nr:Uncharacterised protein [Mycobacteroides abscessus subsp. abscessus]